MKRLIVRLVKSLIISLIIMFFAVFLLIEFLPSEVFASNDEILQEQKNEFGIQDFLQNAEEYIGKSFENLNVEDILNDAIRGKINNSKLFQGGLGLFGKELKSSIKIIGSILVIIVIHSVLKSISESLENDGIAKLIYYVQYILIVTIIMTNFSDIVKSVQDTIANLVGFMQILVPLLITLMISTGSIATSSILEPIILFSINFIGNIMQNIIIPLVMVFTSLVIISKISKNIKIDKISKYLKSGVVWFLGIILTIFVGIISLEGTMSSSVDGIAAKTTKAVVSSAIPVVGKILGDAVDTVLRWRNYSKKCSWFGRCDSYYINLFCTDYKVRDFYGGI